MNQNFQNGAVEMHQKQHFCKMKHLVVFTGAGISAESGIKTFRDAGGLWEGHRIEDVASPEGFRRNPGLVLGFYNQRRRQLDAVEPNDSHLLLAKLEQHYKVTVITQNVDDLHERAGSSHIIHLHGELRRACSSADKSHSVFIGSSDILSGDKAKDNTQLRPDIVWFGEEVPEMEKAAETALTADVFVVIGTSMEVYPAAGILHFVPTGVQVYIVDPYRHTHLQDAHINVISASATEGMKQLYRILVP